MPAIDDAIDGLVLDFIRAASAAHVSVGVFRAALFTLAASELHRLTTDDLRGDAPSEVAALEKQLSDFAYTVREVVIRHDAQRAATAAARLT